MLKKIWIAALAVLLFTLQTEAQVEPLLLYKAQQDDGCREWVEATMGKLTLKEKVGQLFVYTVAPQNTKRNQKLLREAVQTYKVGGLLFSGGRLQEQAIMTNLAQSLARVPLMITFDGEWGLAMRLKKTPSFPKNMALGCIQDEKLLYEYGKEVARECKELGVHVNFAPVADVNINPANPVINVRSFGADPHNVSDKVIAYGMGLESGGVLSVCKHFPGHGDTDVDSHNALPVLPFSRARLDSIELYPFKQAVRAGLGGMMVGHLQVPALDEANFPASLSRNVVYGLLRKELGFKGLVFTDALAMKGVAGNENLCVLALKAGNDMVLTPRTIKAEIESVMDALKKGTLTEEMIDRKCRKVLTYKYALGANKKQRINLSGLEKRICTPETEELIRRLNLSAVTVLGNRNRILPLHDSMEELAVVSIGKEHSDTAFISGLRKMAKVEHYHLAKEQSDAWRNELIGKLADKRQVIVSVTASDVREYETFLSALSLNVPTVYTFFIPFTKTEQLPASLSSSAAVLLGHSSGKEVQEHVAEVLFGKTLADGRLSAGVTGLFKAGEGITINPDTPPYYSPEDLGMNSAALAQIDTIVQEGILAGAFPGCQVFVLKNGRPVYDKCFGGFTYEKDARPVETASMYDLASLSKTTGTLLAVMKLYDRGMFNLTDEISKYLPYLKGTDKEHITINELLLHESGLPPSISFYKELIDKKSYKGAFFKNKKDKTHRTQIGKAMYACSAYTFKPGMVSTTGSEEYNLQVADSFWLNRSFRQVEEKLLAEVPVKQKKYVYSCVNFILLKEMVEHIAGESMDIFLHREFYQPMGLKHLAYLPLRRFSKSQVAPTVKNDFLRRETSVLQGYVHDESAALFGGISGNAGLFGSASDVAAVYQLLLNGGDYKGKRYLSEATCRLFATATSKISRRGLGFDKPNAKDTEKSPCAVSTPASVYGHTGFTGTCAWADPDNDMVYVFLSNRTFPDVWNRKLMQMDIRPRIQETLYEAIKAYSK